MKLLDGDPHNHKSRKNHTTPTSFSTLPPRWGWSRRDFIGEDTATTPNLNPKTKKGSLPLTGTEIHPTSMAEDHIIGAGRRHWRAVAENPNSLSARIGPCVVFGYYRWVDPINFIMPFIIDFLIYSNLHRRWVGIFFHFYLVSFSFL
jgi:hypothetical protein